MPGKTLNSQAQELVLNVLGYFDFEKENGGPLEPLSCGQERVAACCHDNSTKSVRKPDGFDGKCFITVHADGSTKGFASEASLLFSSKCKVTDYHGEMNNEIFMKWISTQLILDLEEPSLIVMDNAPYHSVIYHVFKIIIFS